MPVFIKPGFWNLKKKELPGEINLTRLIQNNSSGVNYKIYSALITQTGVYSYVPHGTELVIGKTYVIQFLQSPDDFSNVGYVENEVPFIATGTTPTSWAVNGTIVQEITSSVLPTIEVIENTLGITMISSYRSLYSFFLESNLPVFLINKTIFNPTGFINIDFINTQGVGLTRVNDSKLILPSFTVGNTNPFTIEIKVYN